MRALEEKQVRLVAESTIERVVENLRAIDHKSAWSRTLEVGRLVLDGLFGGNESAWRARSKARELSLRKLVQHPACPFKKTALSDAVGIHLFVKRNAIEYAGVSPTHVLQVMRLPNATALALLDLAARRGLTVRELNSEVAALRRQSGDRRGRPPSPLASKAETIARRAARLLREIFAQLDQLPDLNESDRAALGRALAQLAEVVVHARHRQAHQAALLGPKVASPTALLSLEAS